MLLSSLLLLFAGVAGPQDTPAELALPTSTEASALDPAATRPQRLLIHGGRIYLGNENGGVVEAMLIEDGRIQSSGPMPSLGVDMEEPGLGVIDLRGAVAVPGLQDAHGKMELLGASLEQVDLRGAKSFEEVVARVAEAAKEIEVGTWIQGWGWNELEWDVKESPTHKLLSEALRSHPVLLRRIDGDAVLVNQTVLELAGLHDRADMHQRIPGGVLVLDEEKKATGLLIGNAQKLATSRLPAVEDVQVEARLLAAQDKLLALGITCVHDMGVRPQAIRAYLSLRERGLLKLRTVAYLDGNEGFSDAVFADMPYPRDNRGMLQISGVSFRLDGSLASRGAALLQDYSDQSGARGRMLLSVSELTQRVHRAWQAGLQPAVGAVGDAANRTALDVYEGMLQVSEGFANLRPRIEFVELISPRDFERFPGLGVTPSMQPASRGNSPAVLLERLGEYRIVGARSWKSQAPGWMETAYGSDFPCNDPNPLEGLHMARTRRAAEPFATDGELPAKQTTGLEALAGYTRGPAYASHQEQDRGQLLPGFWADMTVFDVDPIEGPVTEMTKARVLLTLINGRIAYGE